MAMPYREQRTYKRRYRSTKDPDFRVNLMTFISAFTGAAVGFVAALAIIVPSVQHAVGAETKQLSDRLADVTVAPAELTTSCSQPAGAAVPLTAIAPAVSEISASQPAGGQGGASPSVPVVPVFPMKSVTTTQTASAAINNTGPFSSNKITESNTSTVKINNTTDISIANSNDQQASSGDASVRLNTNGGSATTGAAKNSNSTDLNITVANN